ncbi:MAG TPA: hypothetical protein VER11_19510 [Polyangiaceae bacterium]|nr:hypothetical protein [Polyangiaceae bacterium]
MTRARPLGLIWPYLLAAALGYLLGSIAVPASAALGGGSSNTPLARVGFALRDNPEAPQLAAMLDGDLQAVRSSLAVQEREVFDLVVAVRGLDNGGTSDWNRAERICQALTWPRCDREALTQLKVHSVP